jgi:hypothetical protein
MIFSKMASAFKREFHLLQQSDIPKLLQSRQRQWLQHDHGWWYGSSSVCGYDRPGTIGKFEKQKQLENKVF